MRVVCGRSLLSLSASLALHGLAVFMIALLVPRASPPEAIIVELGEAIHVGESASSPGLPPRTSAPAPVFQGIRRAVGSAPSVRAERSSTPEPVAQPRPPAAPPPNEQDELAVLGSPAGAERSFDLNAEPSEADRPGGGQPGESKGGGIPAGGPLATVAPSARGGGQGVGAGLVAAAPSGGEGGIQGELGPYLARFRQRIQESLHYPPTARRRGLGGTVHLEIELLPTGRVASVVIRSSSSHPVLDEAALDAVTRLSPDPFPPGLPPRPLKVRLPVVFELQ